MDACFLFMINVFSKNPKYFIIYPNHFFFFCVLIYETAISKHFRRKEEPYDPK